MFFFISIQQNKPSNILPALVLRAISFAVHVFLIFVAPIAVIMFLVYVERYSDSKKVWVSPHQVIFLLIGYYGLCISAGLSNEFNKTHAKLTHCFIYPLFSVFDAYFIIVKYSLYKKIKQATVERERGFDLSTFPRTDI